MGELISIGAEEGTPGLRATIDTTGAWVTSLSTGKDHVLFPQDLVVIGPDTLKLRGGLHICSPYFGPDPVGDGPQHGFARDEEWKVDRLNGSDIQLVHRSDSGRFKGLVQKLQYLALGSPDKGTFVAFLSLSNEGGEPLGVSPGFHPYFSGRSANEDFSSEALFSRTEERVKYARYHTSLTNGIGVEINAERMMGIFKWSDRPEEYHCIEPVATSGINLNGVVKTTTLVPGDEMSILLSLDITRNAD